jgi:hypothetical protein
MRKSLRGTMSLPENWSARQCKVIRKKVRTKVCLFSILYSTQVRYFILQAIFKIMLQADTVQSVPST